MRHINDYFKNINNDKTETLIEFAYKNVFRTDFTLPGFVVFDFGTDSTSEKLRTLMVELKNGLSTRLTNDRNLKLNYQWLGRFDQQESTKFHRDNAADQSFLMLGYEPTKIKSRLLLADFMQYAASINISQEEYFEKYNPIFMDGERLIQPYITEVENFDESTFKIVLINNSCSSDTLGVLHNAIIVNKNKTFERVINSMMICSARLTENDLYSIEQQMDFMTTNFISKK